MPTRAGAARWLRRLGPLLAAAAFLAVAFGIEYGGGRGLLPTWDQLHRWLGVETGAPAQEALAAGPTTVTFLDVGQGDAMLIGQDGEYCLIDTGTGASADDLLRDLQLAGVDSLQLLVLTHPHADHIGGAVDVLQQIPTALVLVPTLESGEDASTRWLELLAYLATADIPTAVAEAGQVYPVGGGTLTVLQAGYRPPEGSADDAVNDTSLCTRFEAGAFSCLSTGDAELDAEAALVARYGDTLRATLFKAGHHGSSTANSEALLLAVQPQAIVFSCGLNNEYGHPNAEVTARCAALGIETWRTDRDGSVTFTYDSDGLHVWSDAEAWDAAA